MSPWKTFFNALTLLLLVAIGIACITFYLQWINPPRTQELATQQAQTKAESKKRSSATPFVAPSLNIYKEITDRPLFTEGRLPPEEPKLSVKAPVAPQIPLNMRLEGVVITPKSRVAVIRDLNSNRLLRVSEGMNQNDWKLEAVDTSSATIVRRGKKIELQLKIEKDGKAVPPRMKLPFRPGNR